MQARGICCIITMAVATVALVLGIVALMTGGAEGPRGGQGPAGLGYNPMDIALLRWYEANKAGNSFSVGSGPIGICFDGANIWVANENADTVSKL